jgi:hypothetical protein
MKATVRTTTASSCQRDVVPGHDCDAEVVPFTLPITPSNELTSRLVQPAEEVVEGSVLEHHRRHVIELRPTL